MLALEARYGCSAKWRCSMSRTVSFGQCTACRQTVAKQSVSRHLATCTQRQALDRELPAGRGKQREIPLLHLVVEGRTLPQYWMHLEIPADASLKHLDQFLRDIWLECCGHLSAFTIAGVHYAVLADPEFGDRGMTGKAGALLAPGATAFYEYDFGTTTELQLRSLAERQGTARGYGVRVLARNQPPDIPCEECGQPATQVCSQCIWEGAGWVCESHAKEHACGEDMLLPVVNSPRVGMCGYVG